MEHHIFAFTLIKEGITEKVLQFTMALKTIYNKVLVSLNKDMYVLNTIESLNQEKIYKLTKNFHENFLMAFSGVAL
jgi:hypothetical protein